MVQSFRPPMSAVRRATGFLTESRVAWAQTGNGLQGVHPVRFEESLTGCAPVKHCPGGAGGQSPPHHARDGAQ